MQHQDTMYVSRKTYAICFVKHFWISLLIFLQHVEGYEIKNHCVTLSSLILVPLQCVKFYAVMGVRKVKEVWEVKGVWKGSVWGQNHIYLYYINLFSVPFMMTRWIHLSKPMNNRKLCLHVYTKWLISWRLRTQ